MGISWGDSLSGGPSEVTYRRPSTNRSQNRDFLVIDQKTAGALDVVHIPVTAASGAIWFITGTYRDINE